VRTSWWTAARTTRAPAASPEEDHMSATMSRAEREEFLAGLHVGVLSVASPDGRGPLTAPVWYTYQPAGTVNVSTGRGTRKALAIEAAGLQRRLRREAGKKVERQTRPKGR